MSCKQINMITQHLHPTLVDNYCTPQLRSNNHQQDTEDVYRPLLVFVCPMLTCNTLFEITLINILSEKTSSVLWFFQTNLWKAFVSHPQVLNKLKVVKGMHEII